MHVGTGIDADGLRTKKGAGNLGPSKLRGGIVKEGHGGWKNASSTCSASNSKRTKKSGRARARKHLYTSALGDLVELQQVGAHFTKRQRKRGKVRSAWEREGPIGTPEVKQERVKPKKLTGASGGVPVGILTKGVGMGTMSLWNILERGCAQWKKEDVFGTTARNTGEELVSHVTLIWNQGDTPPQPKGGLWIPGEH